MARIILNLNTTGYRDAKLLKGTVPLAVPRLVIRPATQTQAANITTLSETNMLKRIGDALMLMLRAEYEHQKQTIDGISARDAAIQLNTQILLYAKGQWPFNRPFGEGDDPMKWWENLSRHPDSKVLAVSSNTLTFHHTILTQPWMCST